ncbi:MAG: hypothetical protein ABIJ28_03220 [Patescibacteria group bacterium]
MKVTLPRQCSGREIIEAFKKVAAIEEQGRDYEGESYDSRWKWIPEDYEGEIEYEPGSVRRIIHKGVTTIHHKLQCGRKYIFFGKRHERWSPGSSEASGPQQIRLLPLREDVIYDVVDIRNGRELCGAIGFQNGWHEHLEYDDTVFRDTVEKIIARLFERLQIKVLL